MYKTGKVKQAQNKECQLKGNVVEEIPLPQIRWSGRESSHVSFSACEKAKKQAHNTTPSHAAIQLASMAGAGILLDFTHRTDIDPSVYRKVILNDF